MGIKQIIRGDSLEVLKKMPDEIVDLVITSPPYNAGHDYDNYNDTLQTDVYLENMRQIFKQVFRVLKNDGRVCVNVPFAIKNKKTKDVFFLATKLAGVLNDIGMKDFEFITWHKGRNISHFQGNNTAWGSWRSPTHPVFRPMSEIIMVFYKKEKKHAGKKSNIDISAEEFKKWTKNSWYFTEDQVYENLICVPNNASKEAHPAPFPKELVERLIKLYSFEKDLILDPFNGIGTTTEVSSKFRRNFIGIDLSKTYCAIAYEKVKQNGAFFFTYDFEYSKLVNPSDVAGTLNEIFPYKESFNPKIVKELKTEFNIRQTHRMLEPFLGTGSAFMNYEACVCLGYDTNPLAVEVSKAKLIKLQNFEIEKMLDILEEIKNIKINYFVYPDWKPYKKYAEQEKFNIINSILKKMEEELSENSFRFFKYVIVSNLDIFFNYKRDGNGIKFRNSKISNNRIHVEIIDLLKKSIDIKKEFDKSNKSIIDFRVKSILDVNLPNNIDMIVTSPPYANMFDYFEVYKMELWTSQIIKNKKEWTNLKKSALRSNVNAGLNANHIIDNEHLDGAIIRMNEVNDGLNTRTETMIKNYFYDMKNALLKLFSALAPKSYLFVVVGNSFYNTVPLNTDEILASEGIKLGFQLKEIKVTRKLTSSPQQMKLIKNLDRIYLRESIIVFYKEN